MLHISIQYSTFRALYIHYVSHIVRTKFGSAIPCGLNFLFQANPLVTFNEKNGTGRGFTWGTFISPSQYHSASASYPLISLLLTS
jgi:hypothetical protein